MTCECGELTIYPPRFDLRSPVVELTLRGKRLKERVTFFQRGMELVERGGSDPLGAWRAQSGRAEALVTEGDSWTPTSLVGIGWLPAFPFRGAWLDALRQTLEILRLVHPSYRSARFQFSSLLLGE